MKKIKYIFIAIIMLFVFTTNIAAESMVKNISDITIENFYNSDRKDISEISNLKDDIVAAVDETLVTENKRSKMTSIDVDFNNMYKVYIEADKILEENLVGETALKVLNQSEYLWLLPISIDDVVVTVSFIIGRPFNEENYETDEEGQRILSDKEIEEIKSQEGKWKLHFIAIGDMETDFKNAIKSADKLISNKQSINNTVYFINSPMLRTTVGIVIGDDNNYIKCFNSHAIYDDMKKNNINEYLSQKEVIELSKPFVEQMRASANSGTLGGGGGEPIINEEASKSITLITSIIIIILGGSISALTVSFFRKRNRKDSK